MMVKLVWSSIPSVVSVSAVAPMKRRRYVVSDSTVMTSGPQVPLSVDAVTGGLLPFRRRAEGSPLLSETESISISVMVLKGEESVRRPATHHTIGNCASPFSIVASVLL
jgi:hypothetical protein